MNYASDSLAAADRIFAEYWTILACCPIERHDDVASDVPPSSPFRPACVLARPILAAGLFRSVDAILIAPCCERGNKNLQSIVNRRPRDIKALAGKTGGALI